jgi:hypothetical protein
MALYHFIHCRHTCVIDLARQGSADTGQKLFFFIVTAFTTFSFIPPGKNHHYDTGKSEQCF